MMESWRVFSPLSKHILSGSAKQFTNVPLLLANVPFCHAFPLNPTPIRCLTQSAYTYFVRLLFALTIARNERPVESAVRVQLAPFGRSFAARSLHEELVFVEGALLGAIQ